MDTWPESVLTILNEVAMNIPVPSNQQKRIAGIFLLATTWMDIEGIMLSGVCQAEKDKSYVESKDNKLTETENRFVVARDGEWGD